MCVKVFGTKGTICQIIDENKSLHHLTTVSLFERRASRENASVTRMGLSRYPTDRELICGVQTSQDFGNIHQKVFSRELEYHFV